MDGGEHPGLLGHRSRHQPAVRLHRQSPRPLSATSAYYQFLFGEKLGFRLVDFAATYPSLAGVTLIDDSFSGPRLPVPPLLANYQPSPLVLNLGRADESFTVYDHPKPMVFQKVQQLSAEELRALFEPAMRRTEGTAGAAAGARGGPTGVVKRRGRSGEVAAALGSGSGGPGGRGTFSQMFDAGSLANRVPVLAWWLVVELLGLVALPIVFGIFRDLDDRGYFFAKSVGILLLGYLVWLAASLRAVHTWTSIALMLGLLAAVSWRLFLVQRQAMLDFLRRQRHLILLAEGFSLAGTCSSASSGLRTRTCGSPGWAARSPWSSPS